MGDQHVESARATERVPDDLSKDEIFDLMSNHRRRYTIHHCKQADGPVSLADLAEQVAAWELDKEIDELTSAERKTVYTSLQQTHLKRLDRAGVIEFENGEVELTDKIDTFKIYLDVVPENSIPWSNYYLGFALLSSAVMIGLWTQFLPTEAFPILVYPTILIGVFLASAIYHTLTNYRQHFENFDRPS